jgi:hypothetical protein
VEALHEIVGFVVVGCFAIGWIWGLAARVVGRGPGDLYWPWLAVTQIAVVAQVILGVLLYATGRRVVSAGTLGGALHYVYGAMPVLLLVVAHVAARRGDASVIGIDRRIAPWVPFAWASFISFGLTLRALMTGLG